MIIKMNCHNWDKRRKAIPIYETKVAPEVGDKIIMEDIGTFLVNKRNHHVSRMHVVRDHALFKMELEVTLLCKPGDKKILDSKTGEPKVDGPIIS